MNTQIDPIGKLLGLRYRSHPWHGIDLGEKAPEKLTCYVEMVPTDTVKYESDKKTGYLIIDRPQKYSSILPALYGYLPQTYCSDNVAKISRDALNRDDIVGDGDPLDVCILTEKEIFHGDIIVKARPIGGFRMIDGNEADDKIIAVLHDDAVYAYNDISDCPTAVVDRLKHYFLTYKDMPGAKTRCEIPHIYGLEEAYKVINSSIDDYKKYIENIMFRS